MFTLYNVVSSDGFIAHKDGSEDFIPDELWQKFLDMCTQYGTFVMGRKTYETIQAYDKSLLEPFEKLAIKKIVVTNDRTFAPSYSNGYVVAHSPEDAIALAPEGLVSSGPTLNNYLLEHSLVDKIVLQEVPVAIGEGIEPFGANIVKLVPVSKIS